MEKTIYVNRPASRTWNRLGVNEAAVRWDTDAEALLSNEGFTAVSGENAPLRIEAADGGAAYLWPPRLYRDRRGGRGADRL